jgi:hypothetical protein
VELYLYCPIYLHSVDRGNFILLVRHCIEERNAVTIHLKNIDVSGANYNCESAFETA